MKIVIVTTYRPGDEVGVARVSEELMRELSKSNEVLYVCLGDKFSNRKITRNSSYLKLASVFAKKLYIPVVSPLTVQKVFDTLDEFSPNIIHAQGIFINEIISLIWSIKNKVPFIITFHHIPSEAIGHLLPKLGKKKIGKRLDYTSSKVYTKRVLESVTKVIALNQYVERSVNSLDSNVPVKRLNNGMNLAHFYKLKPKKQGKNKTFIFVGSYTQRKNQEFLIKVFSYLPSHYRLNLYGKIKTNKDYVKKLKKLISNKNIKSVKINDFIDRKSLARTLSKTDYFVSASVKEAQSMVIIESFASSTPVIGLENETILELVNKRNGLTLPIKTNPKVFAEKLKEFVDSEKNYTKLAAHAKKDSQRFQIEIVTKKILKIYSDTIRSGVRPGKTYKKIIDFIPERLNGLFSNVVPKAPKRLPFLNFILSLIVLITTIFGYPFKIVRSLRILMTSSPH